MAYQKLCNHVGKFTGTIYKVHIEKDNIMQFYKSTKNMFINTWAPCSDDCDLVKTSWPCILLDGWMDAQLGLVVVRMAPAPENNQEKEEFFINWFFGLI